MPTPPASRPELLPAAAGGFLGADAELAHLRNRSPRWSPPILGALVLFPLRLLLLLVVVLPAFLATGMLAAGCCCCRKRRRAAAAPGAVLRASDYAGGARSLASHALVWLSRLALRGVLFCLGVVSVEEVGERERDKRKAGVLVSNHISPWEALYLKARCGGAMIAEESNFRGTALGLFAEAHDVILFNRNAAGNMRDVVRCVARDEAAPQLLVFPEGSCSNGTCVMAFKPGAFFPLVPVQPVVCEFVDAAKPGALDPAQVHTFEPHLLPLPAPPHRQFPRIFSAAGYRSARRSG